MIIPDFQTQDAAFPPQTPLSPSAPASAGPFAWLLLFGPLNDGYTNGDWASLIGIVTAIIGNVLISFALNTQRYAHLRLGQEAEEQEKSRKSGRAGQAQLAEERVKANAGRGAQNGHKRILDGDEDEDEHEAGEEDPLISHLSTLDRHEAEDGDLEEQGTAKQKSYLRSPYWWFGIVLMTVGEAGNFLAYGFAPASIVSPLGVVALISNCIIAPIMLKEPFRKRDFLGVLVAVGGAVTVVLSASDNNPKLGPDQIWELISTWEFETYLGVTVAVIAVLMVASNKYGGKSILIDLGLVGLFGGYTALSTKGVASMLSYTLLKALTFPVTYLLVAILVGTAVMQIKYVNRALQRFDSTQVIPVQFVMFTLSVILGSAVLYRDFERTSAEDAGKFVAGCALTFLGVWLITSGRPNNDEDEEERAPEAEDSINLVNGETYHDEVDDSHSHRPSALSIQSDVPQEIGVTYSRSSSFKKHRPSIPAIETPEVPSQVITPATPSSLTANPWASDSMIQTEEEQTPRSSAPLLHTTASAPILPSEAHSLTARQRPHTPRVSSEAPPTSPSPRGGGAASNTPISTRPTTPGGTPSYQIPRPGPGDSPATPQRSSRGSISNIPLLGAPLTSPLSSSLSAIVADSLRRGVDIRTSGRRRESKSGLEVVPEGGERRRGVSEGNVLLAAERESGAVTEGEEAHSPGETVKGRGRSLSGAFGGLLGRVKSRDGGKKDSEADAAAEEAPLVEQQKPDQETHDAEAVHGRREEREE